MSKYDIVITLFTIVFGFTLTELFLRIHKLIRARKIVKWHWFPLLAAWYLFLVILKNLWDLAFFQSSTDYMNICFFIAYGHLLFLIFLSVSTALPDDVQKKGVDLKEYYFKNHRYFWGLMSAVIFVSVSIWIIKLLQMKESIYLNNIIGNSIFLGFSVILSLSKKYWIHATLLILFVIGVVLEILSK